MKTKRFLVIFAFVAVVFAFAATANAGIFPDGNTVLTGSGAKAAGQWDVPDYTNLSLKQTTAPVETETALRDLLADSFDTVDSNGDGVVSYAEALVAAPGLTQEVFNAVDTNGDGKISKEEAECDHGCSGCRAGAGSLQRRLGDIFLGGLAMISMFLFGQLRNRDDDGPTLPML